MPHMKNFIFPIAVVGLLLTSCSSAYRTGQTPDDVYHSSSPAVVAAEVTQKGANDDYQSYWANPDDDYLRMKVQKGGRWNNIDDLDYWYGYSGLCQCNSNWSLYNGFNSFYSPWGMNSLSFGYGYNPWGWNSLNYGGGFYSGFYAPGYYYPFNITSKYPTAYSNPSRPSLRGYGNSLYGTPNSNSNRRMSSSSVPGGSYRTIFGGSSNSGNSNSGSSYERPARTFESSGGSSSGGGSSRSSGGGSSSGGSSSGGSSRGGRGG
jgi:hypothetical protein